MSIDQHKLQIKPIHSIDERLRKYPQLHERLEALLDIVENSSGDAILADEAEELLFQELRLIGQSALTSWADRKHSRLVKASDRRSDLSRKQKKDSIGIPASDE